MNDGDVAALRVRTATESDVERLVAFNTALAEETEAFRLDPERLEVGLRNLVADPSRGHYLVAEGAAGELLGCLMTTYEWSDWRNGLFWWIQSVYVVPEAREQGVFTSLYNHLESAARAQTDPRVVGLRLYVRDDNLPAQTVYRRMGMAPSEYRVYERALP